MPLFIASRTRWLPLSAPIHASWQPASRSAVAMPQLIRSARDWMVKGIGAAAGTSRRREFLHPVRAEAEDVVGKPDVVGRGRRASDRPSPRATASGLRCR